MIKEYNLHNDPKVLDYIKGELSRGLTLSKYLHDINLENGSVVTYLPSNFSEEDSLAVEETIVYGYLPNERPNSELMFDYLQKAETNCIVFEDSVRRPEDPSIKTLDHALFFYESEVYHWLNQQECVTVDFIYEARRRLPARPLIGVFTSLDTGSQLIDRQQVTLQQISDLATRTVAIIVAAYDDTGYLIWRNHA